MIGVGGATTGVVVFRDHSSDKAIPRPPGVMAGGAPGPAIRDPSAVEAWDGVYEILPTVENLPAVLDSAVGRASELLFALPMGLSLDSARTPGFLSLFRERVALLLEPDFDAWVTDAARFGGVPSGPTGYKLSKDYYNTQSPDPGFREKWTAAASATRLTPISIRSMRVIARRVHGADISPTKISVRQFGSAFFGGYHEDTREGGIGARFTDIYEILIPMLHQQSRALGGVDEPSVQDIDAFIGVWLAWDSSTGRWIPYRAVGYDNGAGSAGVIGVPF